MSISIKKRIYLSFTLLVFLFVVNGLITIATLYNNKKLSHHVSSVVNPSLQAMNDFSKMMIESKMYSTNWVFLRYNQSDKDALIKLHSTDYWQLKNRLNLYADKWYDKKWSDSLRSVYKQFEKLIFIEERITGSLKKFEDYNDPVIKLEAERIVEDEIISGTAAAMKSLEKVIKHEQSISFEENKKLESSSAHLRIIIAILAITIICLGLFLSVYFSQVIIYPLEKIKNIVNDMGRGVTQTVLHTNNEDEIGEMVVSVNNLSKKLKRMATFAYATGARNFDVPFTPLSEEDTLGKALVAMRDNLKHSDAQLNEAQHLAHLGSWERDLETDKISWSDEMFCIFDINPASFDFCHKSFLNAIHPDDIEYVKSLCRQNQNSKKSFAYECRIVTPKGVIKTIYVEDKSIFNIEGKIVKSYGITQDITERKKSSLALEDALWQLKKLLDNIDQAFFSVDMVEQKVTQMSVACEKIFGYPPEAFFKNYDLNKELVFAEDLPVVNNFYAAVYAGLQAHEEYRIIHKDGTIRWIEVKVAPTLDKSGKLLRIDGVVSDIGKRKLAELERDNITADLIHRNKDLEQFTYIVSHNLRAPVANIMALSNLLDITIENPTVEHEQLLKGISTSINNLDNIIKDLNKILAVRTPGNEKKEIVSFYSAVKSIKASIKHIIEKEGAVIHFNFDEAAHIYTLRTYIYSIFYNLILNSIKYKKTATAPEIELKTSISNGKIIISFKDNGKGINIEKYEKDMFMLYKRFDTTVEGKGIGLYMVKTAVETLGGSISVKSQLNEGCEFLVELPLESEEVVIADEAQTATANILERKQVLLEAS